MYTRYSTLIMYLWTYNYIIMNILDNYYVQNSTFT